MKYIIIFFVRVYRAALSPVLGSPCRFTPTCSEYFLRAVEVHGVPAGIGLGLKRLLRCHCFHPGGFDPVPGDRTKEGNSGFRAGT